MSIPRSLPPELAVPPEWKGQEPAWFGPTLRSLQELLQLPENWNSYGARPIVPEWAASALKLLVKMAPADTPVPIVVPTTRGGVLLEWHMRAIDLEIETLAEGQFHVFYEDDREGREWEGDLMIGNAAPIAEFLAELSHRTS
jgi:hypothetical protein